ELEAGIAGTQPLGEDARPDHDGDEQGGADRLGGGLAGEVAVHASAAAGGRVGDGGAAQPVAAGLDRAQPAGRHLHVGQDGVDLPRLAVGGVDPDLVLHGVAARHPVLGGGGEALGGEPGGGGGDLARGRHLHPQV